MYTVAINFQARASCFYLEALEIVPGSRAERALALVILNIKVLGSQGVKMPGVQGRQDEKCLWSTGVS